MTVTIGKKDDAHYVLRPRLGLAHTVPRDSADYPTAPAGGTLSLAAQGRLRPAQPHPV